MQIDMSRQETRVDQDQFVRRMTTLQDRLFAYILTLLPDVQQASDVLQETNVVLWRKMHELAPEQNIEAWACQVAYYEVLSFRRDRARERVVFDDALLERIAERSATHALADTASALALEHCLDRLSARQRDLVVARYRDNSSVTELASATGKSASAVSVALHRTRRALLDCIRQRLQLEGGA